MSEVRDAELVHAEQVEGFRQAMAAGPATAGRPRQTTFEVVDAGQVTALQAEADRRAPFAGLHFEKGTG